MLNITPIQELVEMSKGEIVELPPFVQGKSFVARLKRPSMLKLAESGKIPNSLLRAANTLFAGEVDKELDADDDFMKDLLQVVEVMAESVFVEPTWQELKNAGVELTDEQYMFIFNYTQKGVESLKPFREEPESDGSDKYGEPVQMQTI